MMASLGAQRSCPQCAQCFAHKSSLARHVRRCSQGIRGPSRRKACQQCCAAKTRCDLKRPECGRCHKRGYGCHFESGNNSNNSINIELSSPVSQTRRDHEIHSYQQQSSQPNRYGHTDGIIELSQLQTESELPKENTPPSNTAEPPALAAPRLVISSERRQLLLGTAPGIPSLGPVHKHIMHYIIRVLKSWPRMMAVHGLDHLPPIIHKLQLEDRLPTPLVNCLALTKMWADHHDDSAALVQRTVMQEVQRMLEEYASYDNLELLAATQSLLILHIILLFGFRDGSNINDSTGAQLLIDLWEVKSCLAATGLFLNAEVYHQVPTWKDWVIVSAKRRTILCLHHLEYSWSLLHGYPPLTCLELGPLPAPTAKYLWQEMNERAWESHYIQWLHLWKHDLYKTAELFYIREGASLDQRSELWLAETDELGVMLMAEVNAIAVVDQ